MQKAEKIVNISDLKELMITWIGEWWWLGVFQTSFLRLNISDSCKLSLTSQIKIRPLLCAPKAASLGIHPYICDASWVNAFQGHLCGSFGWASISCFSSGHDLRVRKSNPALGHARPSRWNMMKIFSPSTACVHCLSLEKKKKKEEKNNTENSKAIYFISK